MSDSFVIDAGSIVTVDEQNSVLEKHSLLVENGIIKKILPTEEVDDSVTGIEQIERIDRRDHVLMPGLINTHTHLSMSLLRGFADDLPLMTWLQEHIWPAEGQWVDTEFVADGAELAIAESIMGGTTCVNDMYFYPDIVARVAQQSGIRATVGLIVLEFPTVWAANADEYLKKGLALHDQLSPSTLVRTALAPHAPYTVSPETLTRVNTIAAELDIPVHMHVHETATEVTDFIEQQHKRPIELLDELGLLSPSLLAVHMTQLTASEIERVAETGTHVLHCPESNMKLASGRCPITELHAAGVNVAIGTDGAASNNDLDMFGETRSATMLAKVSTGDASAIPASTALRMATINGAKALGLDKVTGSLEPGKSADCITISCSEPDMTPIYNLTSHLVYSTDRSKVNDVWVQGRCLMKHRQLQTIDSPSVMAKASQWAVKIGGPRNLANLATEQRDDND